jgi:subtilase family serine protease
VPEALAGVLVGPPSIHDFKMRTYAVRRGHSVNYTYTGSNGTEQALAPADLQTIYNLTPLYAQGLTGAGQTIVAIEDTDLYTNGDWYAFRKVLGLSRQFPQATLTVVHPATADSEAAIDVEWASAAAPNAAIVLASCKDGAGVPGNFGGFLALQNLLAQPTPPTIVSISYGLPETFNGATTNIGVNTLYQTAVALGVSVFVSSGDALSDGYDRGSTSPANGTGISGWGDTPYNISVGGTDFDDTATNTNSTYWSASNNAKTFGSALSYIPEIPWNQSCASSVLLQYYNSVDALGQIYPQVWGSAGMCNNATLLSRTYKSEYLEPTGGSGGPSACATGAPSSTTPGVVSGTCIGWQKPSWQSGFPGNPTDGVRDIPDVALFASAGWWGHYYVTCYSRKAEGGTVCGNTPSTWAGFGGTSVSTPIMAAIQSLIDQRTGQTWGLASQYYYQIAANQTAYTGGNCNSSQAGGPATGCDFNDVTVGDIASPCVPYVTGNSSTGYTVLGTFNCFGSSASQTKSGSRYSLTYVYGVSANSAAGTSPATRYSTAAGWDFATGIGSVNAFNLVNDPTW